MSDFEIFVVIQKIANLAFDFWSSDVSNFIWLMDYRKNVVNPMYNATKQGIFLEIAKFQPGCLYTPWGEWNPWGSGVASKKFVDAFKSRMELEFFQPNAQGIIYKVLKFNNIELPSPELRCGKYNIEILKAEWEKIKRKYKATVTP